MTGYAAPVPWFERRDAWAMALAAIAGFVLVLLATRNMLSHAPTYDELLHVLSGRGMAATGEPVIADGSYDRAPLFTRLVALAYQCCGDSAASARLPALISSLLIVVLLGAWIARRAGFLAGAVAGGVLALSSHTIGLAVFARFYSFHALMVIIAGIAAYEGSLPSRRAATRVLALVVALAALALAFLVQITTVIAAGAVVAGLIAALATDQTSSLNTVIRARPYASALLVIAVLAVIAILEWQLGLIAHATEAPLWAQGNSGRGQFYLQGLAADLPLFWPLFPLAFIAAFIRYPRLAVFCAVIFVSAMAVHSIAAAKAMRYAYYALPFLCAVIGCGASVATSAVAQWLARVAPALPASLVSLLVCIVCPIAFSQEGQRTARFIAGKDDARNLSMYAGEADWAVAKSVLGPAAAAAELVVVSSGVKGLYYLGRYDYELNGTAVAESENGEEFDRDLRTGRRTISTESSLRQVLDKSRSTLIVLDEDKLGLDSGVSAQVTAFIASRCRPLAVPAATRAKAWACAAGS